MYRMLTTTRRTTGLLVLAAAAVASLLSVNAQAAVPGITGVTATVNNQTVVTYDLTANANYISQPDGVMIYSWGYGCSTNFTPGYVPAAITTAKCPDMQIPGPTLVVTEGQTVAVTLRNNLPTIAGNTSIVFPGFEVTTTGGVSGLLTQEAVQGTPVTYTFTAKHAGTFTYYSGTQADVQVAMGLFGVVIVLPDFTTDKAGNCTSVNPMSLAKAAYNHPGACYDREYMFQLSEIDVRINNEVEIQANACASGTGPCTLNVSTEPFQPQYFMINGRSLPDDLDSQYAPALPHQPYNGNPHIHPSELMLIRMVGQGRQQHPFHIHGNHARVLAYDGNLITAKSNPDLLAGPEFYTLTTTMGQSMDTIFSWTGQGLGWDIYGRDTPHTCNSIPLNTANPSDPAQQSAGFDPVTHEYCPDHGKPILVTPPDPAIVAQGLWYGGTPYMGLQAVNPTPLPPGANIQNPTAGYAFPWHSHHEREITTFNVFPGGLMTMLLVDPPGSDIDESK